MNAPTERKVWDLLHDEYSKQHDDRKPLSQFELFEYWWDEDEGTVSWKDYTRRVGASIERWISSYNWLHNLYTATLTLINSEKFEIKFEWRGERMPNPSGSWVDEEFLPDNKSYCDGKTYCDGMPPPLSN